MLAALALLVGVLDFVPGDTGLPYSTLPSRSELRALGDRLGHDLRQDGTSVRRIRVACADVGCAREAGREAHADRVIFSSATRHMAMIWSAQASIVDVGTGRVRGPYDIGYKGDYDALALGLDTLAAALAPAVGAHVAGPMSQHER